MKNQKLSTLIKEKFVRLHRLIGKLFENSDVEKQINCCCPDFSKKETKKQDYYFFSRM
jgi:hypothetical protein